jgi:hypothetical protein
MSHWEEPGRYDGRLRKADWTVRAVSLAEASALVAEYHYAHGGANTATYLHGLFRNGGDRPLGVAWWIPPTKSAAVATHPENWTGVLALSRMAIVPDVPKNAATFLLARSVRLIDRSRWPCLVTYADEWQGHSGGIYRAAGWQYVGLTKPERTYVKDGRMVARKAGPRTRTHTEMLALGASCIGSFRKHKFINVSVASKKMTDNNVPEDIFG